MAVGLTKLKILLLLLKVIEMGSTVLLLLFMLLLLLLLLGIIIIVGFDALLILANWLADSLSLLVRLWLDMNPFGWLKK